MKRPSDSGMWLARDTRKRVSLVAALAMAITGLVFWRNLHPLDAVTARVAVAQTNGATAGPKYAGGRIVKMSPPVTSADNGDSAIAGWLRRLNTKELPKADRKRAALSLVRNGSDSAFRALKAALASGSVELQEIVAEALGQSVRPESGEMLEGLLTSGSEPVVLAAIRSLSQQASPRAVESLARLLNDDQRSANARAEAALGLGAINRPEALAALADATAQLHDEAVSGEVIRGLAGHPLEQTRAFLEAFLDAPHIPMTLKTEALGGLTETMGETVPFLLRYAASNDPELRAAAAWTLATLETRSDAGGEILALLETESNPLVRKRLYQALANQDSFDVNAAWAQTVAESESGARIAGMELIARTVQQSDSTEMIAFFDQHVLPELKEAALHAGSTDERVASTMALRRSQTPNAAAALREIAAQTHDMAVAAVSGVKAPSNVAR